MKILGCYLLDNKPYVFSTPVVTRFFCHFSCFTTLVLVAWRILKFANLVFPTFNLNKRAIFMVLCNDLYSCSSIVTSIVSHKSSAFFIKSLYTSDVQILLTCTFFNMTFEFAKNYIELSFTVCYSIKTWWFCLFCCKSLILYPWSSLVGLTERTWNTFHLKDIWIKNGEAPPKESLKG